MAKFEFSGWLIQWLFAQEMFQFEWDAGNATKSQQKHDVETNEAEEVFYDESIFPLGAQTKPRLMSLVLEFLENRFQGVICMWHLQFVMAVCV